MASSDGIGYEQVYGLQALGESAVDLREHVGRRKAPVQVVVCESTDTMAQASRLYSAAQSRHLSKNFPKGPENGIVVLSLLRRPQTDKSLSRSSFLSLQLRATQLRHGATARTRPPDTFPCQHALHTVAVLLART
jgi:hypothetical protein